MEKSLEEDFRKRLQLQNDVLDLMAGMGYNESTRGIFEHKATTKEEKKVEKKAKESLNALLRKIRETNFGENYLDSDQSPLKGIEAQVSLLKECIWDEQTNGYTCVEIFGVPTVTRKYDFLISFDGLVVVGVSNIIWKFSKNDHLFWCP